MFGVLKKITLLSKELHVQRKGLGRSEYYINNEQMYN